MVVSSFVLARTPGDILSDIAPKTVFLLSVVHVLLVHVARRKQKPVDGATASVTGRHSPAEFLHVNFRPASDFLGKRVESTRYCGPHGKSPNTDGSFGKHPLTVFILYTSSFLADAWYNPCHGRSRSLYSNRVTRRIIIRNPVINAQPLFCFKNIPQLYAQSRRTEGHISPLLIPPYWIFN
jgi:hypothetical protein